MTQDELLRVVVGVLERLKLRYFVTGSIASIYYGEPRLTNDIDVVVDLSEESAPEFPDAFGSGDFYLSEEAVYRAVRKAASKTASFHARFAFPTAMNP